MTKAPAIARPARPAAPSTPDQFVLAGQPDPLPPEPKAPTKRFTFDLDADLHRRFRRMALDADRDMKDIITDLIAGYVAGER